MKEKIFLSEEEQIRKCLNCNRPSSVCSGECYGLRNSTNHRRTTEEIDALIKQYYSSCETWVELSERTQVNKKTLRRRCEALGLKPLVTLRRGNPNYGKRTYRT